MALSSLAARAYSDGYASHGDIDLQPEIFANQWWVVIERHLGFKRTGRYYFEFDVFDEYPPEGTSGVVRALIRAGISVAVGRSVDAYVPNCARGRLAYIQDSHYRGYGFAVGKNARIFPP